MDERPLIYDVFCGGGGATAGFQRAGFRVVGVDRRRNRHYPGDDFIEMDALTFFAQYLSGYFPPAVAIAASPPCQAHSSLKGMWNARQHQDLIPQTREWLQRIGAPYVIENVVGAPLERPFLLCGSMFNLKTDCGAELRRHRLFEVNWEIGLLPECRHGWANTIGVYGGHVRDRCRTISVVGERPRDMRAEKAHYSTITITGSTPQQNVVRNRVRQTYSVKDAQTAMGISWLPMSSLSQAIPPLFTQFVGERLMQYLIWKEQNA